MRLRPARNVVDTLKRVHAGELPFDRTVKVSLDREPRKGQDPPAHAANLKTLEHLLEQNLDDFSKSMDERQSEEERRHQRRSLKIRRRKTVTLVEELSIRTQKVQPLMRKLEQISHRMDELEQQIDRPASRCRAAKEDRANLRKRAARPDDDDARRPGAPAPPHRGHQGSLPGIRAVQARPVGRQPAARRLHRQEVPQSRPVLPRSDPGGQHRPDASGGQVRVSPRLQVFAPMRRGGFARRSRGPSPTRPARSASRCT